MVFRVSSDHKVGYWWGYVWVGGWLAIVDICIERERETKNSSWTDCWLIFCSSFRWFPTEALKHQQNTTFLRRPSWFTEWDAPKLEYVIKYSGETALRFATASGAWEKNIPTKMVGEWPMVKFIDRMDHRIEFRKNQPKTWKNHKLWHEPWNPGPDLNGPFQAGKVDHPPQPSTNRFPGNTGNRPPSHLS